jgi:hypothetical protein
VPDLGNSNRLADARSTPQHHCLAPAAELGQEVPLACVSGAQRETHRESHRETRIPCFSGSTTCERQNDRSNSRFPTRRGLSQPASSQPAKMGALRDMPS